MIESWHDSARQYEGHGHPAEVGSTGDETYRPGAGSLAFKLGMLRPSPRCIKTGVFVRQKGFPPRGWRPALICDVIGKYGKREGFQPCLFKVGEVRNGCGSVTKL